MKNFENKNEVVNELNEKFIGSKVTHKFFGNCEIESFSVGSNQLVMNVNSDTVGKKSLGYNVARTLFNNEELISEINEYNEVMNNFYDEEEKVKREELLKRELERKAREEEKENERKYENYVSSVKLAVNRLEKKEFGITEDEETWLKDNIKVSASVPDFLVTWFSTKFPKAKFTQIESRKKTSGGFNMKWGLTMKATVKDSETAPDTVRKYINDKNKISDTSYLFNVCLQYGLPIG